MGSGNAIKRYYYAGVEKLAKLTELKILYVRYIAGSNPASRTNEA